MHRVRPCLRVTDPPPTPATMPLRRIANSIAAMLALPAMSSLQAEPMPAFASWAEKPVMGWNSWDFYGTSINETCAKAQTPIIMAANLLPTAATSDHRGHPVVSAHRQRLRLRSNGATLTMDRIGPPARPRTNRFPSATNGAGLQAARGLRPRQGPEIRHPHHARHPAPGRAQNTCRPRHHQHRRRHRRHHQHLLVEPRHVWRGHDQARRAGVLRFALRARRLVGRGFREG